MEKSEIVEFVRRMKRTDHAILFYSKPEDKRHVLFTYLKAGLDQGQAAAYVTGQEARVRMECNLSEPRAIVNCVKAER